MLRSVCRICSAIRPTGENGQIIADIASDEAFEGELLEASGSSLAKVVKVNVLIYSMLGYEDQTSKEHNPPPQGRGKRTISIEAAPGRGDDSAIQKPRQAPRMILIGATDCDVASMRGPDIASDLCHSHRGRGGMAAAGCSVG